ncbi:MAG: M48 family metallopeptidase [bacterium]
MWELIAQNKKKSKIIFFAMFFLLEALSISIGLAIYYPAGGYWGALVGAVIWGVQSLVAYYFGDAIVLSVSKAVKVTKESYPQLYNIVEEMKIAASQTAMPEIYVINDSAMNAFATGIKPEKSAICVTAGLLETLNRDELQGVIAHEMSHIINRDVLFMTFAGVMLGSINLIAQGFIVGTRAQTNSRKNKLGSKSSGSHPALLLIALFFAVVAPLLAQMFYFAISRKREYLADATAVRLTRYPEGLASALEKISGSATNLVFFNKITAPMFIINPIAFTEEESLFSTSTHPPTHDRIAILRALQNGGKVSFRDYQQMFSKTVGDGELLPSSALKDKGEISVREGKVGAGDTSPIASPKSISDLIMAANGVLFMPCACGLKIKAPPTIGKSQIRCPRCGRYHTVPSVTSGVDHSLDKTKPVDGAMMAFKRENPDSWESCLCSCGHAIQLSPLFRGRQVICKKCKSKIQIDYP